MSPDDIVELFSAFGPVQVRRMFGGAGIFADGIMFGLVSNGVIYLKADESNRPAYEAENLEPFSYTARNETRALTSYRRMPERLYDDPDELAVWAGAAHGAALRSGTKSKGKSARRPRRS
jgi:DNA transformation protein